MRRVIKNATAPELCERDADVYDTEKADPIRKRKERRAALTLSSKIRDCLDRPVCTKCKKPRPTAEFCFVVKQQARLGEKTDNVRSKGDIVQLKVEDIKNHAELMHQLDVHVKGEEAKQKTRRRKPLTKRSERAEAPPPVVEVKDDADDNKAVEAPKEEEFDIRGRADMPRIHAQSMSAQSFADIDVDDEGRRSLVDTGADISVFFTTDVEKLAISIWCDWTPTKPRK